WSIFAQCCFDSGGGTLLCCKKKMFDIHIPEDDRLVLAALIAVGYLLYYLMRVVEKPNLVCRENSSWRDFLEQNITALQGHYWPTPWCFESRAQTLMASVLRRVSIPFIHYKREILPLKDGGEVCLDWLDDNQSDNRQSEHEDNCSERATVIILPGLTGCSQSDYVKSFVLAVQATEARCVVFNNRGRGGIQLKTARTYCAANSDDLEEAIDHIRTKYPESPIIASGISLGGMILGNYLATRKENAAEKLVAAMVLSIPWNVYVGTANLEKPMLNLWLNQHLAKCLCDSVEKMKNILGGPRRKWDLDHVLQSKTVREFDTRFTAAQFGYANVDEYYRSACLHDKLDNIKVPLLCLSAADDPFQPKEGIPLDAAEKSSHVAIILTNRGGHIGFMEGLLPTKVNFSDRVYNQLISSIINNMDSIDKIKKEANQYAESKA
ncbi:unnamed protein product, partial [Meganyctiphanes norvegica]